MTSFAAARPLITMTILDSESLITVTILDLGLLITVTILDPGSLITVTILDPGSLITSPPGIFDFRDMSHPHLFATMVRAPCPLAKLAFAG